MSDDHTLAAALSGVTPEVRAILEDCLNERELSWQRGVTLSGVRGRDLHALCVVADHLRARQAGDVVTYVVNRNINFTNVCVKSCKFCAFSRDLRSEQGYFLDVDEVIRRAQQARDLGATEVCIQAGLAPDADGRIYIDLCRAVKTALPELHLHAFSPEEVKYGSLRARMSIRAYLEELVAAGLDSLPGTSAEILDDRLRDRISPGRITTAQWIEVIETAHELGLSTTATMMFGHVESAADRLRHLDLLRAIQKRTGGFTEFVPLSFVHSEAPLFLEQTAVDHDPSGDGRSGDGRSGDGRSTGGRPAGVRPGPTGNDIIALYAIARLMLGQSFRNIQASWVKEGLRMSQWLLACGVNDLGGTLMNESISTAAGAGHGQLVTPATLRHLIRDAGRMPAQRRTDYRIERAFAAHHEPGEDDEPLARLAEQGGDLGSYEQLTQDPRYRYQFDKGALVKK